MEGWDTGFNINMKQDLGNCHFEALRSGISDGEKLKITQLLPSATTEKSGILAEHSPPR